MISRTVDSKEASLALRRRIAEERRNSRRVYFIEARGTNAIKIGHTTDIANRLKDLQAANPVELQLLCSVKGSVEIEYALHRHFACIRIRGEWFRDTIAIREMVATLKAREPDENWWKRFMLRSLEAA